MQVVRNRTLVFAVEQNLIWNHYFNYLKINLLAFWHDLLYYASDDVTDQQNNLHRYDNLPDLHFHLSDGRPAVLSYAAAPGQIRILIAARDGSCLFYDGSCCMHWRTCGLRPTFVAAMKNKL